jgi:GNAT superfamily N-acetyltransferase
MRIADGLRGILFRIRGEGLLKTAQVLVDAALPASFGVYLLGRQIAGALADVAIERGLTSLRKRRELCGLLPSEFYLDQSKGARDCFIACQNSILAGIVWVMSEAWPSRFIRLGANEVEIGYLYVLPGFRGAGIASALISSAAASVAGCRVYAVIDDRNYVSQRVFEKCGFDRIATLRRRPLWGPCYSSS